eukprot:CAMPEP_0174282574 /NCGR_PEP_ID=MMETSP0809-20121228/3114_1 /TAXON_ID=73025 ORGANISM="Eutreptiella gymnastica-like, Strain CCMP1594" /NCGR_SAMPLE_ID=MMETSP0809 /ASSEMBLY_ACC=CAM_ASM_000658 /LENGTH=117 /DNA_ID=CAMNT_0015376893 /DNA_START=234 /DNA_END=588 /DNA_ORIENTATION=-
MTKQSKIFVLNPEDHMRARELQSHSHGTLTPECAMQQVAPQSAEVDSLGIFFVHAEGAKLCVPLAPVGCSDGASPVLADSHPLQHVCVVARAAREDNFGTFLGFVLGCYLFQVCEES